MCVFASAYAFVNVSNDGWETGVGKDGKPKTR